MHLAKVVIAFLEFPDKLSKGYNMFSDEKFEFELLVEEVKKYILEYPMDEQVIVVKTAKGNIHSFGNNVLSQKYEEEKAFVQKLVDEDDAILECIVCMWNDLSLDFPSMNFRKLLIEASEENNHAKMYLGNRVREIQQCMPK